MGHLLYFSYREDVQNPPSPPPPSPVEEDQKKLGVNRVKQLFILYSRYELLISVIKTYNLYFAYWYIN